MTQVTPPVADGTPWTFSYDGQLNRYKIDKGGGVVRYYLWDDLNLLEEHDGTGTLITRYSYGQTPIYGIGSCVEIYQPASGKHYLLVMDHRGTGYVLLDETGIEIGRRWYDAFGVLIGSSGTWPVDFGYQTNWQTVKIGAKSWGLSAARMYDYATGRFTQRDPLGFRGGINYYLYSRSNPIYLVDPTGLLALDSLGLGRDIHNFITAAARISIPWVMFFGDKTIKRIALEALSLTGGSYRRPDLAVKSDPYLCQVSIWEIKPITSSGEGLTQALGYVAELNLLGWSKSPGLTWGKLGSAWPPIPLKGSTCTLHPGAKKGYEFSYRAASIGLIVYYDIKEVRCDGSQEAQPQPAYVPVPVYDPLPDTIPFSELDFRPWWWQFWNDSRPTTSYTDDGYPIGVPSVNPVFGPGGATAPSGAPVRIGGGSLIPVY